MDAGATPGARGEEGAGARFWRDLLPPAIVLALGTLWFRLTDADLAWVRPWGAGGDWARGESGLWAFLYRFGTYPALVAVIAAVLLFLVGCRRARWAPLRRHAIYLMALMAIAPGIVSNVILKDHWGRPRPRDVVEFGGASRFEPVLTVDPESGGKSFPCGHATMGFYFVAGYYLFRRRRRALAAALLWGGLIGGALIGWARVAQGGHFPSDVLWACGIVWGLAALLANALRVERVPPVDPGFAPLRWRVLIGWALLLPAAIFLVLLATPIDRREERRARPIPQDARGAVLRVRLLDGETIVRPGDATLVRGRVYGFGLPGSGVKSSWREGRGDGGEWAIDFSQRHSGLTMEIDQSFEVVCAVERFARVKIVQASGTLSLELPGPGAGTGCRWEAELGAGSLVVRGGCGAWDLSVNGESVRRDPGARSRLSIRLGPGATWSMED